MPDRVVISFGHCAEHYKGGDGLGRMHGADHSRWLALAMDFYRRHCPPEWDLQAAITGWPGWPAVETSPGNPERDWYWQALRSGRFITMAENPGHQRGAAWTIRLGLEAAGWLGYDCLVHTAEDVLPDAGGIRSLLEHLQGGTCYAGQAWGRNQDELCSQFFACRVAVLASTFDPAEVHNDFPLECYLAKILSGRRVAVVRANYHHTHSPGEWSAWVARYESKEPVPCL